MANNLATNTWKIDTPSATPVSLMPTNTILGTNPQGPIYVSALEFSGYASATDEAVVTATDSAGNTFNVATMVGHADLSLVSTNFGKPVWIRNLAVPTLTSGQVTVYLG